VFQSQAKPPLFNTSLTASTLTLPHSSLKDLSSMEVRSVESLSCLKPKWLPIVARKIKINFVSSGTRVWTQGFALVRQVLYHLNHIPSLQTNLFIMACIPLQDQLPQLSPPPAHTPPRLFSSSGSLCLLLLADSLPWSIILVPSHLNSNIPIQEAPSDPLSPETHDTAHCTTWLHFIFFIAFTGIWNVLNSLHICSRHDPWDELENRDSVLLTPWPSSS
jgi:hypothetical protein